MANTIKLKTSSVQGKAPTTSDLQISELAWNSYDGKLYGKKNNGTESIIEIGAGGGGASSLDGLSDVAITSAAKGQFLSHNGTQFVNTRTIEANAAATVPLTIKGAVSQTANLVEAQNSSGTALFSLGNAGVGYFNGSVGIGKNAATYKLDVDAGSGSGFRTATTGSEAAMFYSTNTFQAVRMETNQASALNIITWQVSGVAKGYVGHNGNDNRTFLGNDAIVLHMFNAGSYSGRAGLNTTTPGGKLQINTGAAATKGLILQGAASQTGNLFEAQNSAGTALTYLTSSGSLVVGSSSYTMPDKSAVIFGSLQNGFGVKDSSDSSGAYYLVCRNSTDAVIGSITRVGTTGAVAYNTASDYRMKENVSPMLGALEKAMMLNPVTYDWKDCGIASQGFIAHELQEVLPDAVHGEKDAVDTNGNPVYQGVDYSRLTPLLSAALKELTAKVLALEVASGALTARIAAMEGAN